MRKGLVSRARLFCRKIAPNGISLTRLGILVSERGFG